MERRALAIPALDVWIESETKVAMIVKAHKVQGNLFCSSKPKSMSCNCNRGGGSLASGRFSSQLHDGG